MPPRCAPVLPAAVYRGQKCGRIKRSFGIGTQVLEKLGGGTHVRNVGSNLIWLGKEQHETKSLEICCGITDISTRLESSAHSRYAYMSEVLLFSIGGRRHVLLATHGRNRSKHARLPLLQAPQDALQKLIGHFFGRTVPVRPGCKKFVLRPAE